MSYNPLSQAEDANSESDYSEIRASPVSPTHQVPSYPMSPDLDLRSIPSETWNRPRTVSRDGSGPMQCPTPDLQSIQGAYVTNVERLEQSAERMSLSSDIGEEIRKMRDEQKRSDSRRSSIYNAHLEEAPDRTAVHRQLSYSHGSHASSSIVGTNNVARSGGFSPAAYFASPRGSVRSSTRSRQDSLKKRSASQEPRLEQVTEPQQEGKPLDSPLSTRFAPVFASPDESTRPLRVMNEGIYNLDDVVIPNTESPEPELSEQESMIADGGLEPRQSTDTARQVNGLFTDFDGVHTIARPPEELSEETPHDPPLRSQIPGERPQSYLGPGLGEHMVYYPAPVPMMLNLPKRLSKLPNSAFRDQRRSKTFGNQVPEPHKPSPILPDMPEEVDNQHNLEEDVQLRSKGDYRRSVANMPPQLRATMFFDHPGVRQDVVVKGESAVATLDSILDASASAPVSAFTDHPIVGQVGGDIYSRPPGKPRPSYADIGSGKRSSTVNLITKRDSDGNLLEDIKKRNSLMSIGTYFGRRKSSGTLLEDPTQSQTLPTEDPSGEVKSVRTSIEHADESSDVGTDAFAVEEGSLVEDPESQPVEEHPTTLLAELQMRKQRQKLRNKTAATAFPDGMHSTLLQLDAVAQVEQRARKQKHTVLAWEDTNGQPDPGDQDDEDVPLGMLYPGKKTGKRQDDEDRPLGLIARRQMEDSEPLSHRRARLRGEPAPLRNGNMLQHSSRYPHDPTSNPVSPNEREEDEDDEHPGETLAQRLRRIKETQIRTQPRPVSSDFTSEILSQFNGLSPAGQQPEQQEISDLSTKGPEPEEETLGQRRRRLQAETLKKSGDASGESHASLPAVTQSKAPNLTHRRSMADILQAHPAAGAGVRLLSDEVKYTPAPRTRNTSWAMEMNQQAAQGRLGPANGATGYAPHPMIAGRKKEQTGEDGMRKGDMIDRWRQSVMY